MTVSEGPCRFETANGHAVVTLLPGLNDAPWSEIERVGNDLLDQVRNTPARAMIVDLTALNYMGSALVALIVRVWKVIKERGGQLVVVNRDPMVMEVLRIAGLHSLWTIVETREEAIDALGASPQAETRKRETRFLTWVGPLAVTAAAAGLALLILKVDFVPRTVAVGLALGWSALGALAGTITFARSTGGSRAVGGIVVAASLGLVAATVFFWPDDLAAGAGDGDVPPATAEPAPPADAAPPTADPSAS
ncbi:MAG TPA: STAS domain-containing protein [Planctomycetaceae bacterium]|nr:STAS domain-containing protein [Planctomycetaceae bacterium]